jgi:hypothetical protein
MDPPAIYDAYYKKMVFPESDGVSYRVCGKLYSYDDAKRILSHYVYRMRGIVYDSTMQNYFVESSDEE